MTSSRKKHHPPSVPAATPPSAAQRVKNSATARQWVIRVVGALAVALGVTMTLIGATPGIAGGWGKLALMVPGMVIVAGGFVAIVETTPFARSRRPRR